MSELLSRDNIVDVAGLKAALDAISASPTTGLQAVAEHLLPIPEIFAYVISGISSTCFFGAAKSDSQSDSLGSL